MYLYISLSALAIFFGGLLNIATNTLPRPSLGRRSGMGAPVRRAFLYKPKMDFSRSDEMGKSPLSIVLSGHQGRGFRGGKTRLAFLLTCIWLSPVEPFESEYKASEWAAYMGEEDPYGNGARSVRNAIKFFKENGFIEEGSTTKKIRLMNESLNGNPYTIPNPERGESYFRVPEALWTSGKIKKLNAAGLSMYLIALARSYKDSENMTFTRRYTSNAWGISEGMVRKGIQNLLDNNILIEREPTKGIYRLQITYMIHPDFRIESS